MRLLLLADIHGHLNALDAIAKQLDRIDLAVVSGDLTHFGKALDAKAVLEGLTRIAADVLAVYGNCDGPQVQALLSDGPVGLHGRMIKLGDLVFVGVGGSLYCSGRTPAELDEQQIASALEATRPSADDRIVLVTHQPPFGTRLDDIHGSHQGSHSIRAFIETFRPILTVCGHFHEIPGKDQIDRTILVNPGPARSGMYAIATIEKSKVDIELHQAKIPVE